MFKSLMVVVLLILGLQAQAQGNDGVQRWMNSIPVVSAWMAEHREEFLASDEITTSDLNEAYSQALRMIRSAGLYENFSASLAPHGYSSGDQWAAEASRYSLAYVAVELEQQGLTAAALERQQAQLNAATLPAEQKQAMQQMIDSSRRVLASIRNVSEQDKQEVMPHLQALRQMQLGY